MANRVSRHDAITLHSDVKDTDFERFMKKELLPFFSKRYRGPTRASIADLKSQSLLSASKGQGKYLWITEWDGSPESLRGSSFEHTRLVRIEETEAILKKLDSLGKRSPCKIFTQLASIEVPTNK